MASLGFTPISRPHDLSEQHYPLYKAPEAVSGGIGAVGINALVQGMQARGMMKLNIPGYPKTFGAAFRGEFFWGTILMATALSIIDPEHKIEGGWDESPLYKQHLEGRWTATKGFGKDVAMSDMIPGRSLF